MDSIHYIFWTTDNGAWQDVYPDAGYTPFRSTKGTVREGGNRVPSIAWGPGIKAGTKNSDIVGGLDYMATFAKLADVKLPENDREGKPIVFDSYDMSPELFGTGKSARKSWFYFTEFELSPGAARVGNYKALFNLRGDNGAKTGGLAVDSNLGWKGPESYVATVPQVFDLWQDQRPRKFRGRSFYLLNSCTRRGGGCMIEISVDRRSILAGLLVSAAAMPLASSLALAQG